MDSSAALLLAGLLGLGVGITAMAAFWISERQQRPKPLASETARGDGGFDRVGAVLSVLPSAAVIVGPDSRVRKSSAVAYAYGLVRDDRIVYEPIARLVNQVRTSSQPEAAEFELARGPVGLGTVFLAVQAGMLGGNEVLVLAEDKTESRRLEQIRTDFVANVSHELKTPVGALALLAETMGDAADDPEAVRRFASRMSNEATRLSVLVHEIIEFSRLQVEGTIAQSTPVNIDDVIAESVERAAEGARSKGIELAVGEPSGLLVLGDHALLVTATRNVIDNAINYSEGSTRVGIGASEIDGNAALVIADQGIGIASDDQERVFERFYRVDPARSRLTGGTGLGLSIVKHIVQGHGGEIGLWSTLGYGTTVTLSLPLAEQAEAIVEPGDSE